jgi:hypothetical protein
MAACQAGAALWASFSMMGSAREIAVRDRAGAGHCGARKTAVYAGLMTHGADFCRFEQLSDAELLESLGGALRTQRRSLAELIALLGEVEDRRLHLEAAYGSMFSYCVSRLGMSEDEACRRIELARLARKFPALFAELETGRLTLSVALVLKPVLSPANHLELLAAARGKCVRQARELVASHFPKPDAPSSIRRLPDRQAAFSDPAAGCAPAPAAAGRAPLSSSAATPAQSSAGPEPPAGVSPDLLPLSSSPTVSWAIPSAAAESAAAVSAAAVSAAAVSAAAVSAAAESAAAESAAAESAAAVSAAAVSAASAGLPLAAPPSTSAAFTLSLSTARRLLRRPSVAIARRPSRAVPLSRSPRSATESSSPPMPRSNAN